MWTPGWSQRMSVRIAQNSAGVAKLRVGALLARRPFVAALPGWRPWLEIEMEELPPLQTAQYLRDEIATRSRWRSRSSWEFQRNSRPVLRLRRNSRYPAGQATPAELRNRREQTFCVPASGDRAPAALWHCRRVLFR